MTDLQCDEVQEYFPMGLKKCLTLFCFVCHFISVFRIMNTNDHWFSLTQAHDIHACCHNILHVYWGVSRPSAVFFAVCLTLTFKAAVCTFFSYCYSRNMLQNVP